MQLSEAIKNLLNPSDNCDEHSVMLKKHLMELTQVGTTHRLPEITYHLKQINESGELQLSETIRKIRIPSDKCDE